jgi:hypothetical protein
MYICDKKGVARKPNKLVNCTKKLHAGKHWYALMFLYRTKKRDPQKTRKI